MSFSQPVLAIAVHYRQRFTSFIDLRQSRKVLPSISWRRWKFSLSRQSGSLSSVMWTGWGIGWTRYCKENSKVITRWRLTMTSPEMFHAIWFPICETQKQVWVTGSAWEYRDKFFKFCGFSLRNYSENTPPPDKCFGSHFFFRGSVEWKSKKKPDLRCAQLETYHREDDSVVAINNNGPWRNLEAWFCCSCFYFIPKGTMRKIRKQMRMQKKPFVSNNHRFPNCAKKVNLFQGIWTWRYSTKRKTDQNASFPLFAATWTRRQLRRNQIPTPSKCSWDRSLAPWTKMISEKCLKNSDQSFS